MASYNKVEAIVRRSALKRVLEALQKADYPGITVSEVEGHGKQRGITQTYRDQSHLALLPKMKVEVVVEEKNTQKIATAILKASQSGEIGDGKIFISAVKDVWRIRTGEKGQKAMK
jgi:nitrogen regulatory protein P-II 1